MKKLLVTLSLAPTLAAASNFYAAGTISQEHLRYDVDGWVQRKLDEGSRRDYLRAFQAAGGSASTRMNLTAPSYKIALGYNFTPRFVVELSARKYNLNSVGANISIAGGVKDLQLEYQGHRANITASASATADTSEELTARGYGVSALYNIFGPVFVRAGIEHVKATVVETAVEKTSYSYSVTIDGRQFAGSGSTNTITRTGTKYQANLPLLGIGFDLPLTKRLAWRAEIEHVGIVKYGFDFYSLSLLYKF